VVRERDPDLPVVLAPAEGDEELASEAIATGSRRTCRAIGPATARATTAKRRSNGRSQGRERRQQRERARQFDAIFEGAETHSWVLEPDGTVRRANEPAPRQSARPRATSAAAVRGASLVAVYRRRKNSAREAIDRARGERSHHR